LSAVATRAAKSAKAGEIRIGLSGWSYPAWRHDFYAGVPQRRWLAHCAEAFNAVEVNATFYRLLKPATYVKWHDETPPDFVFAIKGSRFVTHVHLLKEPAPHVAIQREVTAGLGDKLAVVLWQLPARLAKDLARLAEFADVLGDWQGVRHALEFRDETWFDDETAELLARHRFAVCLSDAAGWPLWDRVTTDLVYARLHGHTDTYHSRYSDRALDDWAARVAAWSREGRAVHVYFDNTDGGHAPKDAKRLMARLGIERGTDST
jgi:uncharacterized protein YecE (DUF72 family)